jgi:hypothetical protein
MFFTASRMMPLTSFSSTAYLKSRKLSLLVMNHLSNTIHQAVPRILVPILISRPIQERMLLYFFRAANAIIRASTNCAKLHLYFGCNVNQRSAKSRCSRQSQAQDRSVGLLGSTPIPSREFTFTPKLLHTEKPSVERPVYSQMTSANVTLPFAAEHQLGASIVQTTTS